MTLARTRSVALVGVVGHLVDVEADIAQGLPGLTLVGLPDTALSEARDRVRAAVLNSGEPWPAHRITLNLSPASLPKSGSGFDIALAVGILAASGRLDRERVAELVFIGELGLDGTLRRVRGVLPAVLAASRAGSDSVVVPRGNAVEAAVVPGVHVTAVGSLRELVAVLRGEPVPVADADPDPGMPGNAADRRVDAVDLAEVAGQLNGRFALEIAAAGGHHMFLHGPPGVGKTLLAERLPSILPTLEADEALEVTAIHSVAGQLPPNVALVRTPPFRAPHHSASVAAVVGGGSGFARPGAASLAHCGVLFLDEAPEFARGVLDALRQPLESGRIVLDRARGAVEYPARFQLVLAANPCPCGLARTAECRCPPMARIRYLGRLSGPLLDRVDLAVRLEQPSRADLLGGGPGESSAEVAGRVALARARAVRRWRETAWRYNAHVPGSWLRGSAGGLDPADLRPVHESVDRGLLSARGVDRVLRVAWTLADLAGRARPGLGEVSTALSLRTSAADVGLVA